MTTVNFTLTSGDIINMSFEGEVTTKSIIDVLLDESFIYDDTSGLLCESVIYFEID
jgi:hypothetical protein